MYKYELDSLITDMANAYRLHEFHISEDSDELWHLDFGMRSYMYDDRNGYDYKWLYHELTDPVFDDNPLDYCDGTGTHYLIFREHQPNEARKVFTVLGPFCYDNLADRNLVPILELNDLPLSKEEELRSFISQCPVIIDYNAFHSFVSSLLHHYYGKPVTIKYLTFTGNSKSFMNYENLSLTPSSTAQFAAVEHRYEVENRLLAAVREGNAALALQIQNEFMGFYMEPRDTNPLRDGKDMLIAVNSILRKAVEEAGVHPLYIDHLNARLTTDIEGVNDQGQLQAVCSTITRRYCMLVKTYSRAKYSLIIRDILNYIDFHYADELNLSFFAEMHAISKNYLSALFHKEVGETITDYINETRIRRAILLLNSTSYSMQEIAADCGFSDANYFTRTFKKRQGISPLEYRKSLHTEVNGRLENTSTFYAN